MVTNHLLNGITLQAAKLIHFLLAMMGALAHFTSLPGPQKPVGHLVGCLNSKETLGFLKLGSIKTNVIKS